MKKILMICLFIAGCCENKSLPATTTLISEHEGCKVYKVKRGSWDVVVYYTTCEGSINWEQTNGKSRTRMQNQTILKEKNK